MIDFEIQWLLNELKQVQSDLQIVERYYEMVSRGNTVSSRYDIIEEEPQKLNEHCTYLEKQITTLKNVKMKILLDLKDVNEMYLENITL
jgi:hypothetical protein